MTYRHRAKYLCKNVPKGCSFDSYRGQAYFLAYPVHADIELGVTPQTTYMQYSRTPLIRSPTGRNNMAVLSG